MPCIVRVCVCVCSQYWETLLLNKLKWDVCTVTPNDFLDYVIYRLKSLDDAARRVIRGHAQTFIALCATGEKEMCLYLLLISKRILVVV